MSSLRARARPRDAASLVITRDEGGDARVLLGRRPSHDRFMPDVYVFPGGRVDPGDARVPAESELAPRVARHLGRRTTPARARALGVAALRETWEETGLAFGSLEGDQLRPDLGRLEYLARAITPASSAIRYHARFFHARVQTPGALRSNGELGDLRWWPIEEALELDIIDVTQRVLVSLRERLSGERRAPFLIHYRGGVQCVRDE